MKNLRSQTILLACLFFATGLTPAQETPAGASPPKTDNPSEPAKFKESCGSFDLKAAASCAELLFTGDPLHIAVGSMPPQNGFGAGLAYVGFLTPTRNWRPSWNMDAVASNNASWRAGVYFKLVHTPPFKTTVHYGKPKYKSNLTELPEHPVLNLYAQAISLNKLTYFGLGPSTTEAGRSYYGMTEVITGGNVVKPVFAKWNVSLLGEINGRFVSLRPSTGNASPSIGVLYTDATAPGLSSQPGFLQFGEGIRMRPVFWGDLLHLNYNFSYQQFVAPGDSTYSFERITLDLGHEFALYRTTTRFNLPRDTNGPDQCSIDRVNEYSGCSLDKNVQLQNCKALYANNSSKCKSISRDRQGSVGFRFLYSTSFTGSESVVPFYFQPTLGGGDIDGNPSLSSYQDYRFRAPNVLLLRESFEHSLWGPIGFTFMADEGKVALNRGDFGSSPWLHSLSVGLTLRAGGFPQVFLLFSWGGNEGTHTIANVNTSLLGGSMRPSLF